MEIGSLKIFKIEHTYNKWDSFVIYVMAKDYAHAENIFKEKYGWHEIISIELIHSECLFDLNCKGENDGRY